MVRLKRFDRDQFSSIQRKLVWFLWCFLLVTIPVTSFPWVAKFTGGSVVSPFAGFPLVLIVALWLVPSLLMNDRLSKITAPLLVFAGIALLATVLTPFLEIYPFLGQFPIGRSLRALITLGAGIFFYLVASKLPKTNKEIRSSLRWLYLGGILTLFWSSIQGGYVFQNIARDYSSLHLIPITIEKIHRFFSIRDMFATRVTGLAYEPSFLADQLIVLYLPMWLASVVMKRSIFSPKRSAFSVELGLSMWGLVILFLAQSRIGIISTFVVLGTLGLAGGWQLAGRVVGRFYSPRERPVESGKFLVPPKWLRSLIFVGFIVLMCVAMLAGVLLAAQVDPRVEELFEIDFSGAFVQYDEPIYAISSKLAIAERLMYWTSGFRVFSKYPILGVGLGNSGFVFLETVPSYGYRLPEIIGIASGSPQFPNPKNLWIRLLAETGIIGFSVFMAWLLLLALGAWSLLKKGKDLSAVLGLAGLLAILAQIFEGFSLDTFALPHLWIMLGLITAALSMMSRSDAESKVKA
jgi:O-antigen ligase